MLIYQIWREDSFPWKVLLIVRWKVLLIVRRSSPMFFRRRQHLYLRYLWLHMVYRIIVNIFCSDLSYLFDISWCLEKCFCNVLTKQEKRGSGSIGLSKNNRITIISNKYQLYLNKIPSVGSPPHSLIQFRSFNYLRYSSLYLILLLKKTSFFYTGGGHSSS